MAGSIHNNMKSYDSSQHTHPLEDAMHVMELLVRTFAAEYIFTRGFFFKERPTTAILRGSCEDRTFGVCRPRDAQEIPKGIRAA